MCFYLIDYREQMNMVPCLGPLLEAAEGSETHLHKCQLLREISLYMKTCHDSYIHTQ